MTTYFASRETVHTGFVKTPSDLISDFQSSLMREHGTHEVNQFTLVDWEYWLSDLNSKRLKLRSVDPEWQLLTMTWIIVGKIIRDGRQQ